MTSVISEPTPISVATLSQRPCTNSALRRRPPIADAPSSSTTCASSNQRTASQIATGIRKAVTSRISQIATAMPSPPSSGRVFLSASR